MEIHCLYNNDAIFICMIHFLYKNNIIYKHLLKLVGKEGKIMRNGNHLDYGFVLF